MVFDYVAGKQDWLANGLPVEGKLAQTATAGALASDRVPTCHLTDTLADIQNRVRQEEWRVCVVINEARVVLGAVNENLCQGDMNVVVSEIMDPAPVTFRPHVTAEELAGYMRKKDLWVVLITTAGGRLVGAVRRKDL